LVIFIVNKEGNVKDSIICRWTGLGYDAEVQRQVKENPHKWSPGMLNGEVVRSRLYYQIDFIENKNVFVKSQMSNIL